MALLVERIVIGIEGMNVQLGMDGLTALGRDMKVDVGEAA